MTATHLYVALAIGCLAGITAFADYEHPGMSEEVALGEMGGGGPPLDERHEAMKTALQKKMTAVSDLHEEAKDLRDEQSGERTRKANEAVAFMENYAAKKASIEKQKAQLRADVAADQLMILKTSEGDEKEDELAAKHTGRIKHTMKSAINAMRKVRHLVAGNAKQDPTIKAAKKAVIESRGNEIWTVLSLDKSQLTHDYLLKLDAAVAAYNDMPGANAQEKLEKALDTARERVRKEKIIERKKKKELKSKKERDAENKKYYAQKWKEKVRELKRKKDSRDVYVARLKSENKYKMWAKEQKENEFSYKTGMYNEEMARKVKTEKAHKAYRQKVSQATKKIKDNAIAKFESEQKTLQDKLAAASKDYTKSKDEAWAAEEVRGKARKKITTARMNNEKAQETADMKLKDQGQADELKTKFASESNQKAAQQKQSEADAAKKVSQESGYKLKEATSQMDEADKTMSQAKNNKAAKLNAKMVAEEKAALHKAQKEKEINKALPKAPEIVDITKAPNDKVFKGYLVDPKMMIQKQQQEMESGDPENLAPPPPPPPTPYPTEMPMAIAQGAGEDIMKKPAVAGASMSPEQTPAPAGMDEVPQW